MSPALGEGIEPGDIRQFAPGDRIRQVNWRASLRLGTLYVTQHHRERNADVVLMLDTLAEVGAAPDTTLDLGVRAAASLATAYLARKDRVGLINYGGLDRLGQARVRARPVRAPGRHPAAGRRRLHLRGEGPRARAAAGAAAPRPRDRGHAAARPALHEGRARPRRARLRPRRPRRLSGRRDARPCWPASPTDDLACRLWHLERRARLDELRRHGLAVVEWNPVGAPRAGARRARATPAQAGRRGMIRLPAAAFAAVLFVVPLLTAPVPAVAVIGVIGLAARRRGHRHALAVARHLRGAASS